MRQSEWKREVNGKAGSGGEAASQKASLSTRDDEERKHDEAAEQSWS